MKKYKLLIMTFLVVLNYNLGMIALKMVKVNNNAPKITFNTQSLTLSVEDEEDKLLEGVKAFDIEDGDLSSNVIVENLSYFSTDSTRVVNYIVFDNDDNITRASRTLKYTDYTPPVFSLNNQLRSSTYSTTDLMNRISAYSSVDGDISSKITVMNVAVKDSKQLNIRLSVSDSTNTTAYLNCKYYLDNDLDIDIQLHDYLLYKDVDEDYDFYENIINVIERMTIDHSLKPLVNIEVPDMSTTGIYEVNYSIKRDNGNEGKTTMIVVVE